MATERYALLRAIEQDAVAVRNAYRVPGRNPELHRREQERLRKEWPALARAVERLTATVESGPRGGG